MLRTARPVCKALKLKENHIMTECNQCGKPAVKNYNGHPLCVACWSQVQGIDIKQRDQLIREAVMHMQEIQALENQMYTSVGLNPPPPKYDFSHLRVPQPNIYNNINVENSVVGAINTGEVQNIDIAMGDISAQGQKEIANSIKELTEAILETTELNEVQKNEALENISYLSTQAALPKDQRKKGVIKAALHGLKEVVSTSNGVIGLWQKVEPILNQIGF